MIAMLVRQYFCADWGIAKVNDRLVYVVQLKFSIFTKLQDKETRSEHRSCRQEKL